MLSLKLIDFLLPIIEHSNWRGIYLLIRGSEFIAHNVLRISEANVSAILKYNGFANPLLDDRVGDNIIELQSVIASS